MLRSPLRSRSSRHSSGGGKVREHAEAASGEFRDPRVLRVNAFKFTNEKGVSRYAATRSSGCGEHALSDAEAAKAAPNYLMDELPQRIAKGPVKFRLMAQVAGEGDSLDDPTSTWPPDRKLVPWVPQLDAKPSRIKRPRRN